MGLRCSLFGHTFSETDTRRDREVRGDEVVTVVKTVERCSSCGTDRVVSENKEVVSVVNADDISGDEPSTAQREAAELSESGGTAGEKPAAKATEHTVDEQATEATEPVEPTESAVASKADATTADGDEQPHESPEGIKSDADSTPTGGDAEFITETDGALGGGNEIDVDPNEESTSGGISGMATRSGIYNEGEGGGEPPDAEARDGERQEDAEILTEEERRERAPGQWPDDPDATDEPWEPSALGGGLGTEPKPDDGVEEPAAVKPSPPRGSDPEPKSELLRCPACGQTVRIKGSYRAGDACPECHDDYLEAESE
jgi:hypothetical protein